MERCVLHVYTVAVGDSHFHPAAPYQRTEI